MTTPQIPLYRVKGFLRGTTFVREFTRKLDATTPMDLTDHSFMCNVKTGEDGDVVAKAKCTVIDAEGGKVEIVISSADTVGMPKTNWVADVIDIYPDKSRIPLFRMIFEDVHTSTT